MYSNISENVSGQMQFSSMYVHLHCTAGLVISSCHEITLYLYSLVYYNKYVMKYVSIVRVVFILTQA